MFKTLQYFFGLFVLMVLCTDAGAGTLSRLHLFEPGQVIYSAEINEEFQQLFDAFSGISTTKYISVKNSSASDPVCRFDQLSSGPIAEFKQNGTTKVTINNSGQITSSLALLSPFSITSTTVNTNLNADLLDGLSSADFLQATSPITISGTAPTLIFSDTTSSALDYQIVVDADKMTIEETGGTDAVQMKTNATLGTGLIQSIGSYADTVSTCAISDSGNGSHASGTCTPTTSLVECTCADSDGCDITLGETGVVSGTRVTILGAAVNACNFSDSDGVSELSASFAMGPYDTLTLVYYLTRWIETNRSDNEP